MRFDFHVHTKFSPDSIINPKDLIAKSKHLRIIPAITDHNTMDSHKQIRSLVKSNLKFRDFQFIPGEEIRTDHGDLIGLYLTETIPKKTPFMEALDRIRGQGGIAYIPHMFDYGRNGVHATEEEASKVDVVEIFNARCLHNSYNDLALDFAKKHNKLQGAATDSHFLMEFGHTYTELPDFDLDAEDPKLLLRALKKAKFVTRKAPFFVRGTTTVVSVFKKIKRTVVRP
ncbi:PHP domain-containing protein [Candidatus Micrarchaeota archaeon]|nr:PHP domain-containing protein [Candidatus Micrarchaeota archaeon]